jgi:hypothetical protein
MRVPGACRRFRRRRVPSALPESFVRIEISRRSPRCPSSTMSPHCLLLVPRTRFKAHGLLFSSSMPLHCAPCIHARLLWLGTNRHDIFRLGACPRISQNIPTLIGNESRKHVKNDSWKNDTKPTILSNHCCFLRT